jgi:uncharacterized protein YycO
MELLFFRGTGLINSLVRWQTNAPYAHVAIRLYDNQPFIVESTPKHGVRMRCLRDSEAGSFDRFRVNWEGFPLAEQLDVQAWLRSQYDKKYDFQGILRFITREKGKNPDKWFCSELVFAAFQHIGVKLLNVDEAWRVSPGLLAMSPLLEKIV